MISCEHNRTISPYNRNFLESVTLRRPLPCSVPWQGAASWEGDAVDAGSVNVFSAATLTRVMRAAVPIPAVASASVLHYGTRQRHKRQEEGNQEKEEQKLLVRRVRSESAAAASTGK